MYFHRSHDDGLIFSLITRKSSFSLKSISCMYCALWRGVAISWACTGGKIFSDKASARWWYQPQSGCFRKATLLINIAIKHAAIEYTTREGCFYVTTFWRSDFTTIALSPPVAQWHLVNDIEATFNEIMLNTPLFWPARMRRCSSGGKANYSNITRAKSSVSWLIEADQRSITHYLLEAILITAPRWFR